MKTIQRLVCTLLIAATFAAQLPVTALAEDWPNESAPESAGITENGETTDSDTEPTEDPYGLSIPLEGDPVEDPYAPSIPTEGDPVEDPYAPSIPTEGDPVEDPYAPSFPIEGDPVEDPYAPSIPMEGDPIEDPAPPIGEDLSIPEAVPADTDESDLKDNDIEAIAVGTYEGSCGTNAHWSYDPGTQKLTITGSGAMDDAAFNGQPWYEFLDEIKTVVIGSGITRIGSYAFCMCINLTDVQIPSSVVEFGEYAFYCCSSITSISLPNGLDSISKAAFYGCTKLESIQIPSSVTEICSYAFEKCEALVTVTVPVSVTVIGDSVFSLCTGLTSVSLPNTLNSLGGGVFNGCASLGSITLPAGISTIRDFTFYGCSALTSVEIPAGITAIDYNAFAECIALETILFKGHAPAIHEEAFLGVVANGFYPLSDSTWTSKHLQNYGGTITWSGYGDASELVPQKITKYTNFVTGLRVTWDALPGAYKYELWRSSTGVNGTYTRLTTTTALTYMDKSVRSGVTYSYRLVVVDHAGNRSKNGPGSSHTFFATPDFTLRVNRAVGIGLAWNKVEGATGYAVYRKGNNDSESWVRIATINNPNTLTYNDTTVKSHNGTIYKYTVRAFGGAKNNILSGCYGKGKTMVRLTSLNMTSAVLQNNTVAHCTWTRNTAATGYEVRLMVNGNVAQKYTIGNKTTLSKNFTGLSPNVTYNAQVRCYYTVAGVGSFYSAWSTPVTVLPYLLQ